MISSYGVLSTAGGGPVEVDSDMNSSHTFNISNVNSSYLKCNTLTCIYIYIIVILPDDRIK